MYLAAVDILEPIGIITYSSTTMQIAKANLAQVAALQWDKAPIKMFFKYADFVDLFSLNLAIKLPKNTSIKKHAIELVNGKKLLYRPIYILNPVELVILKFYIDTHLKIGSIQLSKSITWALILFDKKPKNSLY